MISFDIDTMGLAEEFDLDRASIDDLLEMSVSMVTKKFAEHWHSVAGRELNSTRTMYQSAIQIGAKGRFTGVVYLNPAAKIPNMLEMGTSAFDMKTGFLSSPNVKMGKSGPYMSIPFRFGTPASSGSGAGFAGKLPSDVFNAVSEAPSKPLPLSSIGKAHRMPKSQAMRQRMGQLKSKVGALPMSAQTSKYEGVKRNAKGAGYVNFRRVSLNSDPMSWMHSGFSPRNLSDQAEEMLDIPHIVDIALNNFLSGL